MALSPDVLKSVTPEVKATLVAKYEARIDKCLADPEYLAKSSKDVGTFKGVCIGIEGFIDIPTRLALEKKYRTAGWSRMTFSEGTAESQIGFGNTLIILLK